MTRRIKIAHLTHVLGTKDYHLIVGIDDDDPGQGFKLARWGKVGTKGQSQKLTGASSGSVSMYRKELNKRHKRDYKTTSDETIFTGVLSKIVATGLSDSLKSELLNWVQKDHGSASMEEVIAFSELPDIERSEEWGSW